MPTEEELRLLEEGFWTSGPDYYREHLGDRVVFVFPEPPGVIDRDAAISAIEEAPRWTSVEFEDLRVVPLSDEVSAIVYRAVARIEGEDDPYRCLVSSVYSGPKLVLHQQTPLA